MLQYFIYCPYEFNWLSRDTSNHTIRWSTFSNNRTCSNSTTPTYSYPTQYSNITSDPYILSNDNVFIITLRLIFFRYIGYKFTNFTRMVTCMNRKMFRYSAITFYNAFSIKRRKMTIRTYPCFRPNIYVSWINKNVWRGNGNTITI